MEKIDFTKDKLRPIILELANLSGYDSPSIYLDNLLGKVKQLNDFDFECSFFLNIHYLCQENSSKFWNENHRKEITEWLKKSLLVTDVFDTTWKPLPHKEQIPELSEKIKKYEGQMNYLEIVLQGYFNENNREFLEKYFIREYKKAEKEQFFEADEFFNGCLKVIEGWEKHLQDKVHERKRELYLMLNEAKNSTLSYAQMEGKTIEQKRQETIEYCEQELKNARPDGIGSLTFYVHFLPLTNGRIAYNMAYNEVLQIKNSILEAFQKTQTNIEPLPPQPIVKQKPEQETPKTFDELFYNTDLVTPCIDILKELDPPLIDTDCNYIGKLKGVFCVWIDEMQRQGIVKHYSDRKIYALLIPQKINRFSIDESMFGKIQPKAEDLYRTDIKTKVSKIKLSQNSQ